jgi:UDP-N-acetylmuramyl pentapeptide phosphotransferase/UDP-N-acetylglucosamine-1-phosphate transferase
MFSETYQPFFGFVTAFIITFISIPSIIKVAHLKRLFDEPGERTVHEHAVPTLGGLAVFAGVALGLLMFCNSPSIPELPYILAGIIVIFFIGLKDDILVIAPLTKLAGQVFATLIVIVFADLRLDNFHGFFQIHGIDYWPSVFLTIFVTIVIINGFNLIDGIDGLSASISCLAAASFGVWFYITGHYQYALISFALIGALIAFLRFNLFSEKNKIFLGDTGSLINGWIISILVIKFNQLNIAPNFKSAVWGAPAVSFGILIIPLFDTIRVMFIRAIKRQSLFKADKQHIHHQFLKLGFSHKKAVLFLCLINIVFIAFSFYFHNVFGIRTLLLEIIVLAMFAFFIPTLIIERRMRKKKSSK